MIGKVGKKRKPHSEETKQKISASKKGKTLSKEHKQKIIDSMKRFKDLKRKN